MQIPDDALCVKQRACKVKKRKTTSLSRSRALGRQLRLVYQCIVE